VTSPTGRPRWGAVVGGAVAVAVAGLALASRGDVVGATFKSPSALARVGAIVVALVALSLLLRRLVTNALVRGLVMAVPVVALVWLLVVPYFTDETVVESLPGGTAAAVAVAPTTTTPAPASTAPPTPATGAVPPGPAATAPAGPVLLTSGALSGIDHRASGMASVYRLADGSHIVRLDGIDIQNGPDYFVHLVPGAGRESPDGGFDLGPLKGNKGSQNYPIPADVDATAGPFTVLVWCRAFAVPVANASQSSV